MERGGHPARELQLRQQRVFPAGQQRQLYLDQLFLQLRAAPLAQLRQFRLDATFLRTEFAALISCESYPAEVLRRIDELGTAGLRSRCHVVIRCATGLRIRVLCTCIGESVLTVLHQWQWATWAALVLKPHGAGSSD